MTSLLIGVSLIFVSSLTGGVFAFPLRVRRRYGVEHMWCLAFFIGYIVLPHVAVQVACPRWASAIAEEPDVAVVAVLFGLGWGLATVCFAHGISRVGVSLGYAIIMGLATAGGALIPLARRWSGLSASAAATVLIGIALCVAGVAVCGHAGILRERGTSPSARLAGARGILFGLLLCVLSGLLSACANLGFEFAEPLAATLVAREENALAASIVRWLPVYWGGFATVLIYSSIPMSSGRSWHLYVGPGAARDLALALLMGLLLSLTQIPYGMGAGFLGRLGTSVGWAINITASLLVANMLGVVLGEWRQAGRAAKLWLVRGLVVIVVAMGVLAVGNALAASPAVGPSVN